MQSYQHSTPALTCIALRSLKVRPQVYAASSGDTTVQVQLISHKIGIESGALTEPLQWLQVSRGKLRGIQVDHLKEWKHMLKIKNIYR